MSTEPWAVAPHDRLVDVHLDYLRCVDPVFRRWWVARRASGGADYRAGLLQLSRLALTLPSSQDVVRLLKTRVHLAMLTRMSALPNTSFAVQPSASQLRQAVSAPERNRQIGVAERKRVASVLAGGATASIYGGVTDVRSVRQKLSVQSRGGSVDLWDLIRLRVVVASLDDVDDVVRRLLQSYSDDVVRCRNYYTQPRSDTDLWRGIHLTVRARDWFAEIQIMTASREIVCESDHAVAFKRRLAPLSGSYMDWLKRLSFAANLLDSGVRDSDNLEHRRMS